MSEGTVLIRCSKIQDHAQFQFPVKIVFEVEEARSENYIVILRARNVEGDVVEDHCRGERRALDEERSDWPKVKARSTMSERTRAKEGERMRTIQRVLSADADSTWSVHCLQDQREISYAVERKGGNATGSRHNVVKHVQIKTH